MVYFNKEEAKEKTLEYLRYPVPRTPISTTRYLKKELEDFYPNTEDYRATKKLKKHIIKDLEKRNLLVKYTKEDGNWERARELLRRHYESIDRPKPRKLTELYQINFFYLGKDSYIRKLPVLEEINLETVALMYRFIENKENQNYFWNILNLFYSYLQEEYKGKIRVKIHGSRFAEEESRALDRLLEHTDEMKDILNKLPFKPDIEKALKFIESI